MHIRSQRPSCTLLAYSILCSSNYMGLLAKTNFDLERWQTGCQQLFASIAGMSRAKSSQSPKRPQKFFPSHHGRPPLPQASRLEEADCGTEAVNIGLSTAPPPSDHTLFSSSSAAAVPFLLRRRSSSSSAAAASISSSVAVPLPRLQLLHSWNTKGCTPAAASPATAPLVCDATQRLQTNQTRPQCMSVA